MASNVTIGNLTALSTVSDSTVFASEDSGLTRKVTAAVLKNYMSSWTTIVATGLITAAGGISSNTIQAATIGNTGTVLIGTISTAYQPNITSVGTLANLTVTGNTTIGGNINLSGNLIANSSASFAAINNTAIGNVSHSTGRFTTVTASTVNAGTIGNSGAVLTGTLSTSAQTNITSVGTLTSLAVGAVTSSGTIIASTINAGTIGNTGATLTGTLSTAAQTNITSVGPLVSLAVGAITSSGTIIASTINAGTIGNSGATLTGTLSTAAQTNITSVGALSSLTVGAVTSSGTIIASTVNAGTIGNSGATLTGTLSTAAQTNITSVGSLSAVTVTGAATVGNVITTNGVFWANGVTYSSGTGGGSTAASALTGSTLASGVTASSLTSVGTLTGLTVSGAIVPNANVSINLGGTTAWWNNIYGKAVQAQYADLAENYTSIEDYPAGTVVAWAGVDYTEELIMAQESHTPMVAGVISTNPAYLMNSAVPGLPLALSGRVPCRVLGPVRKGDRLAVVAPGVAGRLDPAYYQPGCVIGYALASVPDGELATIEVVIMKF